MTYVLRNSHFSNKEMAFSGPWVVWSVLGASGEKKKKTKCIYKIWVAVVVDLRLSSRETPLRKLSGPHAVAIRLLGLPPIVLGRSFVTTQW